MINTNWAEWPANIKKSDFPTYKPRSMRALGVWEPGGWAIKAYGIQSRENEEGRSILAPELVQAAKTQVANLLPLTREEGEFYKTGFAVLHHGVQANWLLFQWWAHDDVWCQLLSYSDVDDPLRFKFSSRPIRACVYETAILWHEQKAWINHVLNGNADRRAYLEDMMTASTC
ncbi:MAG: hypothetical protein ABJN40_02115 [Sneathiella sp.]